MHRCVSAYDMQDNVDRVNLYRKYKSMLNMF